ncbi:hypothetical protein H257_12665 [Aphanomyces astaci]|uniref:Uncharacterized protein n=1 Tax=Aphanomyces astaci TaxID=112090 RepID=W4FZI8_APHAT|nr:hypothetical protein H257_12665 [Aphanomyces astaci]ETV72189.1 hypothetical protein H257_12665 [Aphanomyces astaci]|eukprot:XP_009838257.1 hypothetical protein H257_12665 [Aphanomyces astaci]
MAATSAQSCVRYCITQQHTEHVLDVAASLEVGKASQTRPSSREQCSRYFFSATTDSNDETTGRWRCTLFQSMYAQEEGRGYTNLLNRNRAQHRNRELQ